MKATFQRCVPAGARSAAAKLGSSQQNQKRLQPDSLLLVKPRLLKLLVCLLCNCCIFNNCSLSFKKIKNKKCVIVYCDVVNVQPHFNLSDEIIK